MNPRTTPQATRHPVVRILALPESSGSVLYGFLEVLSTFADSWTRAVAHDPVDAGFDVDLVAPKADAFRCFGGAPVAPRLTISDVDYADVVIVTDLAIDPAADHRDHWPRTAAWLRRMLAAGSTICSVCSGSVLLAAAGLLDGRAATTHWLFVDHFRRFFPRVRLQPNRVLLPDGPDGRIVTAGGMAAWEDLALYLIARYHGEAAAVRAARLFLFGDRSEGQLLYAAKLLPKRTEDASIRAIQNWVADHYAAPNCVARMVEVSGLAERTFKRRFKKATGYTPLDYVQMVRIEEAKQVLESTGDAVDQVARTVGYEDPTSFRRLFKRLTGVTPGRYRQRYRDMSRMLAPGGRSEHAPSRRNGANR